MQAAPETITNIVAILNSNTISVSSTPTRWVFTPRTDLHPSEQTLRAPSSAGFDQNAEAAH